MSFIANVRQNSGWDDPQWRRFVRRWGLVSLLLIGVASWFSYGFFQFDEYYQITEFVSFKLGRTPPTELAWEYYPRIRPWLQPGIYYAAARALGWLGVQNPFTLSFAFRVISGLCGWTALVSLMLSARALFSQRLQREMAVKILALLWILPYFAVRTSSESLSGDFLTLGVAMLVLGSSRSEGAARRFSLKALAIAGICFGLAFEFRFQTAFAVAGAMFWVLFESGRGARRWVLQGSLMLAAVAVPIAIGTLVDHWGYGEWTFTPWNYFRVNILEHKADEFGTAPVWWYFNLVNENLLLPITLLWTAATLIAWVRFPRHILTWTVAPFILAHCLVGHKEVRFLFPVAALSALFFVQAFVPDPQGETGWFARHSLGLRNWVWEQRTRWPGRVVVVMNMLALASVCLCVKRPGVELQKFIYDQYGENTHCYLVGEKDPYQNVGVNMFFYRPPGFVYTKLGSFAELNAALAHEQAPFLLITDQITLEPEQVEVAPQAALVYRTYPEWLTGFNYLNWLERSRTFSMYALGSTDRTAHGGAPVMTAKRDRPARSAP